MDLLRAKSCGSGLMIYCSYPRAQYLAHREAINAAIARVLDGDRYILGSEVESFEAEFADWVGCDHAVGVNSGTDALFLALKALDIGAGDEVIAPSHTAVPTVAAIGMAGARPVLVDVEADYYTLDPDAVAASITSATSAIIAVHLYGQPADLNRLKEIAEKHDLALIEDCAQAHGARIGDNRVGCIGDLGCFSFFPTKNLGALGDGGAVVSNNPELVERLRRLRQYGWDAQRVSLEQGYNSRLDELQAAILRAKLPQLELDRARREELAAEYNRQFEGLPLTIPEVRLGCSHAYHLYVMQLERRDDLLQYLKERGVLASIHYPVACHQMPAYQDCSPVEGGLSITESLVDRVLSLPMYPELGEEDQATVVDAVKGFFGP